VNVGVIKGEKISTISEAILTQTNWQTSINSRYCTYTWHRM